MTTHFATGSLQNLPKPDPCALRHRKFLRLMDRRTMSIISAVQQFREPINQTCASAAADHIGIITATATPPLSDELHQALSRHQGRPWLHPERLTDLQKDMPPLAMLEYLPNMPAAHLAIEFGFAGPLHSMALEHSAPAHTWDKMRLLAEMWLLSGCASQVLAATIDCDHNTSSCEIIIWGPHANN